MAMMVFIVTVCAAFAVSVIVLAAVCIFSAQLSRLAERDE
jgi:hypothetical protein